MIHLLLLEEVNLLGLLTVALLVESHKLKQQVEADLRHRLRHVDFPFELWVHRQERSSIKFLKSRHKHDLQVFDSEHIKVSEVEFGGTSIDKKLAIYALVKGGAVRCLHLW